MIKIPFLFFTIITFLTLPLLVSEIKGEIDNTTSPAQNSKQQEVPYDYDKMDAKQYKEIIEKQNNEYKLAEKVIKKIKIGVTKENEIMEWLGPPIPELNEKTFIEYLAYGNKNMFPYVRISQGNYPLATTNQKVIGYGYVYGVEYDTNRMVLLVTIDKDTKLVQYFHRFEIKYHLDI